MKKLAFFVLAAFLIAGCNSKKEDKPVENKPGVAFDTSDVKTKPVDNPNQSFYLRYKFEKDKKYAFRLTTMSSSIQSLIADTTMNQNVKQTIVYLLEVTTKEVDKDSTSELSINISTIDLTAEGNGKKFKYQTGQKVDSTDKLQYAQFDALVNNAFSVTVSKIGEVTDVFKVDKIVNKLLEISGGKDKATTEEKGILKQRMVEGGLKPILTQLFRKVPANAVAKDTTWENKQPAGQYLSYTIQTSNTFKVNSLEMLNNDKIAVVDAGLKASAQGQANIVEKGVPYNIKKPSATGDGKLFFNVTKGMIQKSKTKSRVEMGMTAEVPSKKGGKQKVTKKEVNETSNLLELL